MGRITEASLRRLKQEVSIIKLCRSRGVALRRTAVKNELAGRCPFPHCRKHSFIALAAEDLFYCTSCRAGGGALDFVVKADRCDYRAATETLLAALPTIRKPGAVKRGAGHASNP